MKRYKVNNNKCWSNMFGQFMYFASYCIAHLIALLRVVGEVVDVPVVLLPVLQKEGN